MGHAFAERGSERREADPHAAEQAHVLGPVDRVADADGAGDRGAEAIGLNQHGAQASQVFDARPVSQVAQRHFAFEAVAWYWHFVDVVWLGLFVFVYWL